MVVQITPLKDDSNKAILSAIRRDASTDYQRRIPDPTKAGVQASLKALANHRPSYNEFLDALVNRIGSVIARNTSWTNPLAEFKRGMLQYGDTIEEIQSGLLQAHVYDPDREYLENAIFGTERPDVEANFHRVNRQDYYKITINEPLLQRAFLDDSGLSSFVAQLLEAPSTSDQWDEFLLTTQLFREYESNGGFYHVNVPDVARIESSEADAKTALRKLRAMADTLKFVSTKYNAAHMPTFANPDELCIFVTPEFNAAIDVEALAGAFNVSKAEMYGRIIPIPTEHFGIDGCQAIMTVRDFFVIADQRLENTSQYNPVALHNNYFLHHWQVVSASRFVPAVMFHTGADDEVIEVSKPVTSVDDVVINDVNGTATTTVLRGNIYQAVSKANTTPEGGEDAVRWSVEGATSPHTHITNTGVLHVGGDEGATNIKVRVTSTWLNPENLREDGVTKVTGNLSVSGDAVPEWPEQGRLSAVEIIGIRTNVVDGTTAYTFTTDQTAFKTEDVRVISEGSISSKVTIAGKVITVKADPGVGAAVSYTFTATAPTP